jgi:enamine deaminase RidA (YjgF/YER057c/UK114 family)
MNYLFGEQMKHDSRLSSMRVEKQFLPGMQVITLLRNSHKEFFINAILLKNESFGSMFKRVASVLQDVDAVVVSQEIFGVLTQHKEEISRLTEVFHNITWPVTWIEREDGKFSNLSGTQIWAVKGTPVKSIEMDGRVVGSLFEDSYSRYCRLGDIRPAQVKGSKTEQAVLTFEKITQGLHLAGMDFSNVIRTWFYNDDILSWYGDFNKVRTDFFKENNIFNLLVPASTGIGSRNVFGSALIAGLLAVSPKDKTVQSVEVLSPLQSSALDYHSSFSRAVELAMPDHKRVFISGTASIAPDGKTVHLNDVKEQTKLTMRVVEAILKSRDQGWSDVIRAIAYFKHAEDSAVLGEYCTTNDLPRFPVVVMPGDVCRDDLLFEIEVDAVSAI